MWISVPQLKPIPLPGSEALPWIARGEAPVRESVEVALDQLAEVGPSGPGEFRDRVDKNEQMLEVLEDTLDLLPADSGASRENVPSIGNEEESSPEEYDAYFGVVRSNNDPLTSHVRGLAQSYREVLLDARHGTNMAPPDWLMIRRGFSAHVNQLARIAKEGRIE